MDNQMKKEKISELVKEMLIDSHESMLKKIDKVLNCGCIDIESWSTENKPMVLPKTIVAAILESESTQYYGWGTSYEKQIKKEVKNIRYFI